MAWWDITDTHYIHSPKERGHRGPQRTNDRELSCMGVNGCGLQAPPLVLPVHLCWGPVASPAHPARELTSDCHSGALSLASAFHEVQLQLLGFLVPNLKR